MDTPRRNFFTSKWAFLLYGIIIGLIILLGIRFVAYMPERVHYHANFAVYLDGKRYIFDKPKYYEEVTVCSVDGSVSTPQQRVHLHDEDNSAVHVHDHAVTWGQLFANLGWTIGEGLIKTDDGTSYTDSDTKKVSVTINGEKLIDSSLLANRVIQDRDRMLLSYGDQSDTALKTEYDSIPATAEKYDTEKDPASCGGDEPPTFEQRLIHLF